MQPAAALKTRVRVLAEEDYEEEMRFRRRKRPRWWSALLQVCGGWGVACFSYFLIANSIQSEYSYYATGQR